VRLREAIDAIDPLGALLAGRFERKMEKTADVIILIEEAKDALGFLGRKPKACEGQRASEAARELAVFFDDIAQSQGPMWRSGHIRAVISKRRLPHLHKAR